jgi:hypothetical protein
MKKVQAGDVIALLMDIADIETPFFGGIGNVYSVSSVDIDPTMPSGYSVTIFGTNGFKVIVDRSVVVHYEDWKAIHNAVIGKINTRSLML